MMHTVFANPILYENKGFPTVACMAFCIVDPKKVNTAPILFVICMYFSLQSMPVAFIGEKLTPIMALNT